MFGLLHAPCHTSNITPDGYVDAWEDVSIEARAGGSFRGYFIPGANGATIIIPPTLSAGRDGRLREAAMLASHGYSVLTYESRPCAGLGTLSLGYHEIDEVADTLDYLLTREEVDPDRIGIYGYSAAGATSVMAAARLPGLKAVVAEGGYDDFVENGFGVDENIGFVTYFLTIYHGSIKMTYRWITGLDINVLSPIDVIGEITPRPILLIYGSQEVNRPGYRQKAAAGDNVELWIVPGASHGTYLLVAPEEYEARIVTFFDETLLNN